MVNVIGLGYIGLPTALMLSSHGIEVAGTDMDPRVVDSLRAGKVTFREEGLEELFAAARQAGIRFSTAYEETDTYIISVPTPYDKQTKKIDPSYVVSAVKSALSVCLPGSVLVIESTVSPGTIDRFVRPLAEASDKRVHLVHAPERIIPGNMVCELYRNDRTIGADDPAVGERVKQLYASFCGGRIVVTDIRTAEMTKVVENTFRAVNIGFANELAKICRRDGMDVYKIIDICNMHPRVNILKPGPGVGGHCISVDPWFLVGDYPGLTNIIRAAMETNDSMPDHVLERAAEIMEEKGIAGQDRVGLYGLTYKENIDDIRESPALQLLEKRRKHLADPMKAYDPFVKRDIVPLQYHDLDAFLQDVDMVILLVRHDEIVKNMEKLRGKVILDCCRISDLPDTYSL